MKEPKVALYGIGGVYNYGCEAIVRGTVKILHEKWPDVIIDYISKNKEDDIKRLNGCNVKVKSLYKNEVFRFFYRCANKIDAGLKKIFKDYKYSIANAFLLNWVNEYDVILSIGGDIYTLPPDSELQNLYEFRNSIIDFGRIANKKGKKVIVFGASIGPFDKYPKIKDTFFNHFISDITYIIARENETARYLKENNFSKFDVYSDPAFVLEPNNILPISVEKKIGINLSPLSNLYNNNNTFDLQCNTIIELNNMTNMKIILLPHVISKYIEDDDYRYMLAMQNKLKLMGLEVEIAEKDLGYIGIKEEICKCQLVIAARMHCAINAISCGIPSVFLSYSSKSIGMCEWVYGSSDNVVPLEFFNDINKIYPIVNRLINDNHIIRTNLNIKRKEILKSAYDSANVIERLLKNE